MESYVGKTGDVYNGYWKADKQNGLGKLTKKNSEMSLKVILKDGVFDGEIIIHFSDGSKFKGIYRRGKRNGRALEVDKDGRRF